MKKFLKRFALAVVSIFSLMVAYTVVTTTVEYSANQKQPDPITTFQFSIPQTDERVLMFKNDLVRIMPFASAISVEGFSQTDSSGDMSLVAVLVKNTDSCYEVNYSLTQQNISKAIDTVGLKDELVDRQYHKFLSCTYHADRSYIQTIFKEVGKMFEMIFFVPIFYLIVIATGSFPTV